MGRLGFLSGVCRSLETFSGSPNQLFRSSRAYNLKWVRNYFQNFVKERAWLTIQLHFVLSTLAPYVWCLMNKSATIFALWSNFSWDVKFDRLLGILEARLKELIRKLFLGVKYKRTLQYCARYTVCLHYYAWSIILPGKTLPYGSKIWIIHWRENFNSWLELHRLKHCNFSRISDPIHHLPYKISIISLWCVKISGRNKGSWKSTW